MMDHAIIQAVERGVCRGLAIDAGAALLIELDESKPASTTKLTSKSICIQYGAPNLSPRAR